VSLEHLKGMPNYFDNIQAICTGDAINKGIGKLTPSNDGQCFYLLSQGKRTLIELTNQQVKDDIDHCLSRGGANLVEIVNVSGIHLNLRVVCFLGKEQSFGELNIHISSQIHERAKKLGITKIPSALAGILKNDLCITGHIINDNELYIPILVGGGNASSWEGTESEVVFGIDKGITILGKNLQLFANLEKQPVKSASTNKKIVEVLTAKRITYLNKKPLAGSVYLAKTMLSFSDKEVELANFAKSQLKEITSNNSESYFNVWDKYGDYEGEALLSRARDIGVMPFISAEFVKEGVKLIFERLPGDLHSVDSIEILHKGETPEYLEDRELSFKLYSESLLARFSLTKKKSKTDKSKNIDTEDAQSQQIMSGQLAQILKLTKTTMTIDLSSLPDPQKHIIVLSIAGDKVQIERRMTARKMILEGRSANPQLGLIIDEDGQPTSQKRASEIKALTDFVEKKIFSHPPTVMQREAIRVALNTPDICLIQGPPGTGKTTVVAAILERLNQLFRKTDDYRGQVLVSGFQHDAVENLLSRLSINAIPSIKFGRKTGTEFSPDKIEVKVSKWCENTAESIRNKYPKLAESEVLKILKNDLVLYQQSPTDEIGRRMLFSLQHQSEISKDVDISMKIRLVLEDLAPERDIRANNILPLLYGLRCQKVAFRDDGPDRASDLYNELKSDLSQDELSSLRRACMWKRDQDIDFLNELKELRRRMLLKYRPRADYKILKPQNNIIEIVQQGIEILKASEKYTNGVDAALVDFLYELEFNQNHIKDSMAEYNLVSGATVQQSLGKDIREFKKGALGQKNDWRARQLANEVNDTNQDLIITYDTVVIDEAARCSPRDLLIPLSQAEKRIILVGDHRQLPHIIDEEIARNLEEGEQKLTEESMFEYLFRRLKKLEKQDNIKRTVTLDAQFRTHPVLGDFTSKYFYEINDPEEAYSSPLPAKYFTQELPGVEDLAAVWLDVPNDMGPEQRNSTKSRFRVIEAEAIAQKMSIWLNSEEGKNLTFGVISFYRAQVTEIYKALNKYGITELINGNWEFTSLYRHLPDGEERIRIGTVDSFQGMEFDVVCLSMVRTGSPKDLSKIKESDERTIRRLFGHLMSPNRLCVSMSRQKKLLVLAGDANLAELDITKAAVPGIYHYLELCKTVGLLESYHEE